MPIFEPSTQPSWSESNASSADSRARMSAKPDSDKASSTTTARRLAAVCGLNSPVLFAVFDPTTWSPKTLQASLLSEELFPEYAETWPDAVMWDALSLYALQTSGPATSESESSSSPSWPTPNAHDAAGARGPGFSAQDRHYKEHDLNSAISMWRTPDSAQNGAGPRNRQASIGAGHQITIAEQAEYWQTPGTDSFRSRSGDRKNEMGLDQQARMHWVTPNARDWKSETSSENNSYNKSPNLSRQVYRLSPQDQQIQAGRTSSPSGPISRQRLSPRFVEWLLGLPLKWTEL